MNSLVTKKVIKMYSLVTKMVIKMYSLVTKKVIKMYSLVTKKVIKMYSLVTRWQQTTQLLYSVIDIVPAPSFDWRRKRNSDILIKYVQ